MSWMPAVAVVSAGGAGGASDVVADGSAVSASLMCGGVISHPADEGGASAAVTTILTPRSLPGVAQELHRRVSKMVMHVSIATS